MVQRFFDPRHEIINKLAGRNYGVYFQLVINPLRFMLFLCSQTDKVLNNLGHAY